MRHLPPPDRRTASVDHIRPIAAGGTDTRDNVRITHQFCNANRRDDDAFSDDELAERRQDAAAWLLARGFEDQAARELTRPRRVSDPVAARRALAARLARIEELGGP